VFCAYVAFDTLGDSHGWRAGLGAAAALLGASLALMLGYSYSYRSLVEAGDVVGRGDAAAALWLRGCGGFGRESSLATVSGFEVSGISGISRGGRASTTAGSRTNAKGMTVTVAGAAAAASPAIECRGAGGRSTYFPPAQLRR
jgi:hypothetical protein